MANGLLDGLVVLDLTRVLAGPFAGMLLADMGATNARTDKLLMAEGNELADLTIALASKHMPVATSDLAINGKELLQLVGSEKIKDTFAYLLERVQSQNLPNEPDALMAAINKKLLRKQ